MGIGHYIREIGRGKDGARPLDRARSRDLFGQVLDGAVTDLEVGAFCLAMRIKGETPEEMAGYIDATRERLALVPASASPLVVLPSYNGARKLPLLTPLLALLLAREDAAVLIHGTATEERAVAVTDLLPLLGIEPLRQIRAIAPGEAVYAPTEVLSPALKRLLDVRRVIGVRNPAHSLVKLLNPSAGAAVVVGSYTHAEYATSMGAVHALMGGTAMLLRGTEGEPVADPRRLPAMTGFVRGLRIDLEEGRKGTATDMPDMPSATDAAATAAYTRDVLAGRVEVPVSIAMQVEHILRLVREASHQETSA